jgi:hypothetical protein
LSMFPWTAFRSTKAAVKLHTLLDLRGAIPKRRSGSLSPCMYWWRSSRRS